MFILLLLCGAKVEKSLHVISLFVGQCSFAEEPVPNFYAFSMQVNKELISRLEKLARLQLTEMERAKFAKDLSGILEMVDKLREPDTAGVEPLSYPTEPGVEWRDDLVGKQLTQPEALKNAPKQDGQFFRVPKMID